MVDPVTGAIEIRKTHSAVMCGLNSDRENENIYSNGVHLVDKCQNPGFIDRWRLMMVAWDWSRFSGQDLPGSGPGSGLHYRIIVVGAQCPFEHFGNS